MVITKVVAWKIPISWDSQIFVNKRVGQFRSNQSIYFPERNLPNKFYGQYIDFHHF